MKIAEYKAIKRMRQMIAQEETLYRCCKAYKRYMPDEGLYYVKKLYDRLLLDYKNADPRLSSY